MLTRILDNVATVLLNANILELNNYMKHKAEIKVGYLSQFYLNADDDTIKLAATNEGKDPANAVSEL